MQNCISTFIGEPRSIDPCYAVEHDGVLILKFLCDPLVDFEPTTGVLRPAAAESWILENDCKRVRFFLRKNVLFHHGREVIANDYIYSLNRIVLPETNSDLACNLNKIVGYDDVRAGKSKKLSGIYSNGKYELIIELNEPFAEIISLFGHRMTAPIPKEVIEDNPEKFKICPISNGPYAMLESWSHNKNIKLKRFENYYGKNEAFINGGCGQTDNLEFRIYDNLDNAFQDWLEGRLDITKVPPCRIAEAIKYGNSFRKTPCGILQYIGFPINLFPFNDYRVRKAVLLGIDRQDIITNAFAGFRPIANGIIPPIINLINSDAPQQLLPNKPNIAEARSLLNSAGIVDQLVIPFYFNSGLGHETWITLLIEQFYNNLNIILKPYPLKWNDFLDKLKTNIDGIFRMTWVIDYPSIDNILFPLFHSDSIGSNNFVHYKNTKFDNLIQLARTTQDLKSRHTIYKQAESIICKELPILPLWFGMQHHVVSLDNINFNGNCIVDIFGEPSLRYANKL